MVSQHQSTIGVAGCGRASDVQYADVLSDIRRSKRSDMLGVFQGRGVAETAEESWKG
jgi:hypothetical protein